MSKIKISFFDECQNKISFNQKDILYKYKKNKNSMISFFFRNYEIDIENRKSVVGGITKEDLDFINNEFITLFHPYYQKLGWENAVINQELIIKWKRNKEIMEIIIRPDIQDDIDLLNPPHIKISFKKGLFEITNLEKPTCCD